jgi:putative CocE/NonD family hydrolase
MLVRQAPSDFYRDFFARGGAHQLWVLRDWVLRALLLPQLEHPSAPAGSEALVARLRQAHAEIDSWCRHLPLKSFPPVEGVADWYFEQLAHPEDGPYWWNRNVALKVGEIDVPILHVTSWFDLVLDGVLRCVHGIRAHGRDEAARQSQRLVIGPWIHGPDAIGARQVGELDFGPQAELDFNAFQLAWFDHWLKGVDNDVMNGSPIRLFLMGADRWLDFEEWPPAGTVTTPLYLCEGRGGDGGSLNNGGLTFASPDTTERSDSFVYDPDDPLPSLLTYPQLGPRDHRPVERRLLTYTTGPLERDLTVIGPVKAVLHALSSAPDTDWVVRLCDVWPDGRSMSVCDGILRARYRESFERPALLRPGQLYRFDVDMSATAQVFRAGHRVRVEVASSDFPRYDRNLNTGGAFGEEVCGQIAVNTIFHDALRASHILLPVLPAGGTP